MTLSSFFYCHLTSNAVLTQARYSHFLHARDIVICIVAVMILTTSKHDLECICIHLTPRRSAPARNNRFPVCLRYIALCLTSDAFVITRIIRRNISEGLFDWPFFGNSRDGVSTDALDSGYGFDTPIAVLSRGCCILIGPT